MRIIAIGTIYAEVDADFDQHADIPDLSDVADAKTLLKRVEGESGILAAWIEQ